MACDIGVSQRRCTHLCSVVLHPSARGFKCGEDFFFWAISSNHWLAALDLGAGVEHPVGCLIVQNRQAMQSMGRSMDWTMEDNMVDGLFFCATLTGRRGGHIPFVQADAETPDTGAEAVMPDPGCSWEGHYGGGVGVGDENAESCGIVCPLRIPFLGRPAHRTHVVVVRQTDELLYGGYKWVSRFEAPCIFARWTGERWVEQVSRLQGVLETMWLHCDEA